MLPMLERLRRKSIEVENCLLCQVSVVRRGGTTTTPARIVYEILNGSVPDKAFVKTTCKRENCINPDHLYIQKWKELSTKNKVVETERQKLVAGEISEIRQRYRGGETVAEIAFAYRLTPATVWAIVNRQIWKMLP